jgi:phosphoserine phosphatase
LSRKLIVFDCDGVLTNAESSWGFLHKYFGSGDNKYFAELYRRGLISYLDWMIIDVALMIHSRGAPIKRSEVEEALRSIEVKREAYVVVNELKKRGHEVAVVSSGVDLLVQRVCRELGINICLYNELVFAGDELIPGGVARVPLRDKSTIIKRLASDLGFKLDDVVYIGDSSWDIEVFKAIPTSIAIMPCGEACKYAKYTIENLLELLDIIDELELLEHRV